MEKKDNDKICVYEATGATHELQRVLEDAMLDCLQTRNLFMLEIVLEVVDRSDFNVPKNQALPSVLVTARALDLAMPLLQDLPAEKRNKDLNMRYSPSQADHLLRTIAPVFTYACEQVKNEMTKNGWDIHNPAHRPQIREKIERFSDYVYRLSFLRGLCTKHDHPLSRTMLQQELDWNQYKDELNDQLDEAEEGESGEPKAINAQRAD